MIISIENRDQSLLYIISEAESLRDEQMNLGYVEKFIEPAGLTFVLAPYFMTSLVDLSLLLGLCIVFFDVGIMKF